MLLDIFKYFILTLQLPKVDWMIYLIFFYYYINQEQDFHALYTFVLVNAIFIDIKPICIGYSNVATSG